MYLQYLPYIFSAVVILIPLIIYFVIKFNYASKQKISKDLLDQIQSLSDGTEEVKKKGSLFERWVDFWGRRFYLAGFLVSPDEFEKAGRGMLFYSVLVIVLFAIFFQNIGIGLVPLLASYMLLLQVLEGRAEAREMVFNDQIPVFLSILKSNIQANETPERAFMNAISETEDPLFNELKIAKNRLEVADFITSLRALRQHTSNSTLKFLCGCIEIAVKNGSNLKEQLEVIEEMLENSRILKRKLAVAISSNKPLLIVSSILVPGMFLFTYFTNAEINAFWFREPVSWIFFILLVLVFGGGLWLAKSIIKDTGNF